MSFFNNSTFLSKKLTNFLSSVPELNSIIKSLKIPAPVYAEQTKLSHLFSAFDKKIELETNVMTKFMQQKQYLLANLLI